MLIARVVKGASAEQAGLLGANKTVKVGNYKIPWGGDIITHINQIKVKTMEDLAQQIETRRSGDVININLIRDERVLSIKVELYLSCLLYTSPSPRDGLLSRMPSSA